MGEALITRRSAGMESREVTFSWGYNTGALDGWTNWAAPLYPLVDGEAAKEEDLILVQHPGYPNDPSKKLFAYFDADNKLWRLYNASIYTVAFSTEKGYKARLIKGVYV